MERVLFRERMTYMCVNNVNKCRLQSCGPVYGEDGVTSPGEATLDFQL